MGSENKFGRREQKYLYGRKECETIVIKFKKKWIVITTVNKPTENFRQSFCKFIKKTELVCCCSR